MNIKPILKILKFKASAFLLLFFVSALIIGTHFLSNAQSIDDNIVITSNNIAITTDTPFTPPTPYNEGSIIFSECKLSNYKAEDPTLFLTGCVKGILQFLIITAVIVALINLVVAGLRATASGNNKEFSNIKTILQNLVIGLLLITGGWFAVGLLNPAASNFNLLNNIKPINYSRFNNDLLKNAVFTYDQAANGGTNNNTNTKTEEQKRLEALQKEIDKCIADGKPAADCDKIKDLKNLVAEIAKTTNQLLEKYIRTPITAARPNIVGANSPEIGTIKDNIQAIKDKIANEVNNTVCKDAKDLVKTDCNNSISSVNKELDDWKYLLDWIPANQGKTIKTTDTDGIYGRFQATCSNKNRGAYSDTTLTAYPSQYTFCDETGKIAFTAFNNRIGFDTRTNNDNKSAYTQTAVSGDSLYDIYMHRNDPTIPPLQNPRIQATAAVRAIKDQCSQIATIFFHTSPELVSIGQNEKTSSIETNPCIDYTNLHLYLNNQDLYKELTAIGYSQAFVSSFNYTAPTPK